MGITSFTLIGSGAFAIDLDSKANVPCPLRPVKHL